MMFSMQLKFILLALISHSIYALPTINTPTEKTARTSSSCNTYVDTFDNYTTVLVAPELSPVGVYHGLYYSFDAAGTVPGVGITPASSPNVAAASVNQDLIKLGVTTLNPFGIITTNGTSTKSFTLVEFYYACVVSTNGIPVPTGCGLDVYGYDVWGKRTSSAAFNYAPRNQVVSSMDRAILPLLEFVGLKNVTIAIATATINTATTVLYIDNVTHINCY